VEDEKKVLKEKGVKERGKKKTRKLILTLLILLTLLTRLTHITLLLQVLYNCGSMCLAIPAKIISKDNVDVAGVIKKADFTFIDNPKTGEYVLLHAGFAIQKIDEKDALEALKVWNEIL